MKKLFGMPCPAGDVKDAARLVVSPASAKDARMTARHGVDATTWRLAVAVAVCAVLVLPGVIQAQPVSPVVEESPSDPFDDPLDDPFDDPFDEGDRGPVYDPWESFNTKMFAFNYRIDRYMMKPAARAYQWMLPPDVQQSFGNAFDNVGFAPRFLNNVLQGKFGGAWKETQRFLLNSTLGVGGFFDVAKYMFGIPAPPAEDVGQTLAVHGMHAGPYLILPFFPPLTVRDTVGFIGGTFLNPISYFLPFVPNIAVNAASRINDRARLLKTFEGVESSTIDLYGAVRAGYLDGRSHAIQE